MTNTAEHQRLDEIRRQGTPWKHWGPYLSERQWGTVREDYSEDGNAWNYFSHDQSRSRAHHWGEDGLAGISDDRQLLCFAIALWNGRDPILKERLFGLTNGEGNHGEDVKEYYFYLDSTPTHSYMKYLYKYPQQTYPYEDLVATNRQRRRDQLEYELLDTGIFDEDRYFDVFVEYAKAGPRDILIRVSAVNRGPQPATLHVLPTLWFRNTWSWQNGGTRPVVRTAPVQAASSILVAGHPTLGEYQLLLEDAPELLFTNNETNNRRLFGGENLTPYLKDAFHDYVVYGRKHAISPDGAGTKAAAHYRRQVDAGQTLTLRMRLVEQSAGGLEDPLGKSFEQIFTLRSQEADTFYESITPASLGEDERRVMRQALAGMLWTKQYFNFDADLWLREHQAHPLMGQSREIRNREWYHMINEHVISMPDKWEYPWYAAWDLAFHCIALSAVDPDFAREQMVSTTSACSTAAPRFRPGATWSRPTAPPGWRCSVRT